MVNERGLGILLLWHPGSESTSENIPSIVLVQPTKVPHSSELGKKAQWELVLLHHSVKVWLGSHTLDKDYISQKTSSQWQLCDWYLPRNVGRCDVCHFWTKSSKKPSPCCAFASVLMATGPQCNWGEAKQQDGRYLSSWIAVGKKSTHNQGCPHPPCEQNIHLHCVRPPTLSITPNQWFPKCDPWTNNNQHHLGICNGCKFLLQILIGLNQMLSRVTVQQSVS